MTFIRLSGYAGIGFPVVVVSTNVLVHGAGLPDHGAESGELAAFFSAERSAVEISSASAPLAWLLITVFAAGAVARLLPQEWSRREAWSLVGAGGVLMQSVIAAVWIAIRVTLAGGAPVDGGLWHLHNMLFILNGMSLAIAMLGFSMAGLRTGVIRSWLGGLGLVSATLMATSSLLAPATFDGGAPGLAALGLVGWLLWAVWLIGYGVVLVRDRVPATSSVPVTA